MFKLVARPGEKQMLAFVTEQRRKDLAEMVAAILGRAVKLDLVAADTMADEPQKQAPSNGRMAQDQRREAMQLPLVREVVDLFEASLIDVKQEPQDQSTAEPTESDKNDV